MTKENETATALKASAAKPSNFNGWLNSLKQYETAISMAAPAKGLEVQRIITMAATVISQNDKLKNCSPKSVINAVLNASAMGLNPLPQVGECWFVPYGGEVQLQLGYKGLVKKGYKSGVVKSIYARAVYQGDTFDFEMGSEEVLRHKSSPESGDPDKVIGAYCVVKMEGGEKVITYLNKRQIERLRMKSPMQKNGLSGPWATDYDQMAIAKVVKQGLKLIPMEDEWSNVTSSDGMVYGDFDSTESQGKFVDAEIVEDEL